jgi:tetratricopeptide (TPR) repeat protein
MTRAVRIAGAAALAAALFLVLGVGPWRRAEAPATSAPAPAPAGLDRITSGSSIASAIASLEERLEAAPDDAGAAAALGLAYVQRARVAGDPADLALAESVLRHAAPRLEAGDASGAIGLAAVAAARHDFAGSLDHARRATRIAPYDGAAFGVLGDALLELGRYDEAFGAFQRMVDVEPGLAAYTRVSYARELQGDIAGARRALRFAAGVAPGSDDQAFVRYHLGELARTSGDGATAAAAYREAAGFAPGWAPPLVGLARVAWARGDTADAIERLRPVVERLPLPEYATLLGEMLAATGDDAGARAAFDVVRAQARLLEASGVNTDLEIALFEADHGDPLAAVDAARAEWERRRSVHVADAYAWALFRAGDPEEAARYAGLALRLGTRSAVFSFHAGMIAAANGDEAAATALLRQALRIDPAFSITGPPEARRALRELGA